VDEVGGEEQSRMGKENVMLVSLWSPFLP
jgi:hypothetical protein